MNLLAVPRTTGPRAASLLCISLSLLSLALMYAGYNPSNGSRFDFNKYHYPTVLMFRVDDIPGFMQEMFTATGPLIYAVLGVLDLGPTGSRVLVLAMHLACTMAVFGIGERVGLARRYNLLLTLAFYLCPWRLGQALWANPETLAMLMLLGGTWLGVAGRLKAGAAVTGLSVLARQTTVAYIAVECLVDWRRKAYELAATKAVLAAASLALLVYFWGGLNPPSFKSYLAPNMRTFLVAGALFTLALFGDEMYRNRRQALAALKRCALLLVPVCLLYNASAPFEEGGFVFSRIDSLEARFLPVTIASPLMLAAILGSAWPSLRREKFLAGTILICTLSLSLASILYVRYVDFFLWPTLLLAMVHPGIRSISTESMVRSAVGWSLVSLLLATIKY